MAQAPARAAFAVRLFDAHCHLKDPPRRGCRPLPHTRCHRLRRRPLRGQRHLRDWYLVKQMAEEHPAVVPCFGLHPWWVPERSPDWMDSLRRFFAKTLEAAVGEVEVFQRQLELAKELKKPVSVHCVHAFGGLLEILKRTGTLPSSCVVAFISGICRNGAEPSKFRLLLFVVWFPYWHEIH